MWDNEQAGLVRAMLNNMDTLTSSSGTGRACLSKTSLLVVLVVGEDWASWPLGGEVLPPLLLLVVVLGCGWYLLELHHAF